MYMLYRFGTTFSCIDLCNQYKMDFKKNDKMQLNYFRCYEYENGNDEDFTKLDYTRSSIQCEGEDPIDSKPKSEETGRGEEIDKNIDKEIAKDTELEQNLEVEIEKDKKSEKELEEEIKKDLLKEQGLEKEIEKDAKKGKRK